MFKLFRSVCDFIGNLWLMFVTHFPGYQGERLRYRYWKKRLRHLGDDVTIETGVTFLNPQYISIGNHCQLYQNVSISGGPDNTAREKILLRNADYKGEPGAVYLGNNVNIGMGTIIVGNGGGIYFSDNCGTGPYARYYALTHHYRSKRHSEDTRYSGSRVPHELQCVVIGPVHFGVNVNFAMGCTVLPGVSIAENCFITANSVLYGKRYDANLMISGNPGVKIGTRFRVASEPEKI